MKSLQAEHRDWLARHYPNQPIDLPAAGMVEEAGELLHAFIAQWRVSVFGAETRNGNIKGDIMDALGDCCIYLISYCNAINNEVQELWDRSSPIYSDNRTLVELSVELVRVATEHFRNQLCQYRELYVRLLKTIAWKQSVDLEACVKDTWAHVKARKP